MECSRGMWRWRELAAEQARRSRREVSRWENHPNCSYRSKTAPHFKVQRSLSKRSYMIMGVSKEDQKRYLKLHNQFDADTTTWSERLNREFKGAKCWWWAKWLSREWRKRSHSRFGQYTQPTASTMEFASRCPDSTTIFGTLTQELAITVSRAQWWSQEKKGVPLWETTWQVEPEQPLLSVWECHLTDAEVLQETKMIKAYKEEKVKQGKLKDAVIMSSKIGLADRPKLWWRGGQVLRERAIYG